MTVDYTAMHEDELRALGENGDASAHFELGRRYALTSRKTQATTADSAQSSTKAARSRYGKFGLVSWLLYRGLVIASGPACIALILYAAYYAAREVFFSYHHYSLVEMAMWYIGTFCFISIMLKLASYGMHYLMQLRPVSTLLILLAILLYLYEEVPISSIVPF